METQYLSRDPEIMSGALCFKGTRVSVQTLFDYLKASSLLDAPADLWRANKEDESLFLAS